MMNIQQLKRPLQWIVVKRNINITETTGLQVTKAQFCLVEREEWNENQSLEYLGESFGV